MQQQQLAAVVLLSYLSLAAFFNGVDGVSAPRNSPSDLIARQACPEWNYDDPSIWGGLCTQFTLCSTGTTQSPIDIPATTKNGASVGLHQLDFTHYVINQLSISNTGHTIEVEWHDGSTLDFLGESYQLHQFHFHTVSENQIQGVGGEMEIHLVHQKVSNLTELLVVGALIQNNTSSNNTFFQQFFNLFPQNETVSPLNYSDYYHFMGSLTTPGCGEGVKWIVLKDPIEASPAQVQQFRSVFAKNARPVQSLNGRDVYLFSNAAATTSSSSSGGATSATQSATTSTMKSTAPATLRSITASSLFLLLLLLLVWVL